MTDLAPIVPKVMICATESRPYFSTDIFDDVAAPVIGKVAGDHRRKAGWQP